MNHLLMKCIAARNSNINTKVIFFIATVNKLLVLNLYVVNDSVVFSSDKQMCHNNNSKISNKGLAKCFKPSANFRLLVEISIKFAMFF